MKRVLTISYYAPPVQNAESILVWKTLRSLSKFHNVSVMTVASRVQTDPYFDLPPEIHFNRLPDWKPANWKLRRVMERTVGMWFDENVFWSRGRVRNAIALDFDVIYSRSQPGASHVLAWRVKQWSQKPWIAQFSDPWANNPYHNNHTRVRQDNDRLWEERVVREADQLIFPTEEIQNLYETTYPKHNISGKSVVLPHHYTPELYDSHGAVAKSDGAATVRYFGDFYGIRSPEPFFKAMNLFAEKNPALAANLAVEFVGNVESKFHALLKASPVPILRNRMSYVDCLRAMKQTDVLLLVDAPSPNGVNIFLPSKLIDYLGAGRPILAITDPLGTTPDILRSRGHNALTHDDVEGTANALEALLRARHSNVESPKEFVTDFVVGKLADLIDTL